MPINLIEGLRPERAKLLHQEASTHGLLKVWDDGRFRWLTIADCLQSAIDTQLPERPCLPHSRLLNLALLPRPKSALLAGLGGGDLLRQFSPHLPEQGIVCVENCPQIISVYEQFFRPGEQLAFDLKLENINDFLPQCQRHFDLIVLDIFIGDSQPSWMLDEALYKQCLGVLSEGGQLAINLAVRDREQFLAFALMLRRLFAQRVLFIPIPACENFLLLAFRQPLAYSCNADFVQALDALSDRLPLGVHLDMEAVAAVNVSDSCGELDLWSR